MPRHPPYTLSRLATLTDRRLTHPLPKHTGGGAEETGRVPSPKKVPGDARPTEKTSKRSGITPREWGSLPAGAGAADSYLTLNLAHSVVKEQLAFR